MEKSRLTQAYNLHGKITKHWSNFTASSHMSAKGYEFISAVLIFTILSIPRDNCKTMKY